VPVRRGFRGGPAGSLLLHLLPLLAFVSWLRPPLDIPAPIPVQLVIEQPPPPPAPTPAAPQPKPKTPPPGRLSSDDYGKVGPNKGPQTPDTEQPAQNKPLSSGTPEAPAEPAAATEPSKEPVEQQTQTASLVAPPIIKPPPRPNLPAVDIEPPPPPPPEPPAPKRRAVTHPSAMTGLVLPLPLQADSRNPAIASARYPGPSATRDEYCAYALSLVLRHLDLLPDSLVAARRGETLVTIRLRTDGSIMSAMVSHGSGYIDIDERVTKMVYAVGKFPPLPSWVTTSVADFTFRLHFPHGPPG